MRPWLTGAGDNQLEVQSALIKNKRTATGTAGAGAAAAASDDSDTERDEEAQDLTRKFTSDYLYAHLVSETLFDQARQKNASAGSGTTSAAAAAAIGVMSSDKAETEKKLRAAEEFRYYASAVKLVSGLLCSYLATHGDDRQFVTNYLDLLRRWYAPLIFLALYFNR